MPRNTLDVELRFKRLPTAESAATETSREVYDLTLLDYSFASPKLAIESVELFPDEPIPALGLSPRQFLERFSRPGELGLTDGLNFGRWLEDWLFPLKASPQSDRSSEIREAWDDLIRRASEIGAGRPLRLLVAFPQPTDEAGLLCDLPFELLARSGFYFRKPGWSVVRCFEGTEAAACELDEARIAVIWANTPGESGSRLPDALFSGHEQAPLAAHRPPSFRVESPLRNATVDTLQEFVRQYAGPGLDIASIIAHGSAGAVWLHKDGHQDYPNDPGSPFYAVELAGALLRAKVKIALLWCCHTARGHAILGSVARALLTDGRLVAVVAAHAALRAEATAKVAGALFKTLVTAAGGQFDQALSEARLVLDAGDLQWAAPLYYARPDRGESASLEWPVEPEPEIEIGGWLVAGAPALTPYFVGRDDDVARALGLVVTSRLVTLTGLPGAGKSELALAVVDRLGSLPDRPVAGATWISLAEMNRAADLRARVAAAFDLRDVNDDQTLATRLAARRQLLILDNAEDLIAADRRGMQQLVAAVLAQAPGMRFLLTSRQPLGDPSSANPEHEIRVDCLPDPYDRQLFAAAAGARLAPEEAQSSDLGELIKLLAGHPRSLVLVAGQIGRGMSLAGIRRRIERDAVDAVTAHELIGVLTTDPDAVLRTKRLVSSLNLAYAALERESSEAAELFRWLGLLPGGMPAVLLPLVFGERSEERLVVLLRHSLVAVIGPDRRLTLPAPLRWFAWRKLEQAPDELPLRFGATAQAWRAWLGFHYSEHLGTEASRRAVRVSVEETDNLDKLVATLDTLSMSEASEALALAATVWAGIESFAGRAENARSRLADWAARLSKSAPGGSVQANTLRALGDLQVRTARLREAEESYRAALPIYRQIEARLGEANTLRALGDLQVRTARLREAEESYRAALPIYRQIEDRLGEANTLRALGDLQVRTARLREAEESYRAALPIYRQIEDRLGEANTLRALGDLQVRTARLREAEESYRAALPIYRQIESRLGEANTLQALGDLQVRTDRLREAEESYRAALPIYRQIEDRLGEANTLQALGDLQVRTDRLREAEESYRAAVPIYRQIEDRLGEANTLQALGDLQVRTARLREAEESYRAALPIYRQIEDRLGEANTLQALGDLQVRTDRLREAEESYRAALPIYRQIEDRLGEANTLQALGDLQVRTARLREAEESYRAALPIYRQIEARLGEANTLQGLGRLALAQGSTRHAFALFREALVQQQAIDDRLGMAGSHIYLARAALAAGEAIRSVVLAGRGYKMLREIDDEFGQALASYDLLRGFAQLHDGESAVAAMYMAWAHHKRIDDPAAEQLEAVLREVMPEFDPQKIADEVVATCRERVFAAAAQHAEAPEAAGIDPLGPLTGPEEQETV